MKSKAVDHHNMMEGRGFSVEQLKIWTFVFRFLGLVCPRHLWLGKKGQIPKWAYFEGVEPLSVIK